jgi:copper oxidase (laccase) domain-containing protein
MSQWTIQVRTDPQALTSAVFPKQIHTGEIVTADSIDPSYPPVADGVIVVRNGKAAGIETADCLPLVITSTDAAIALHVSRKTVLHGLLDKVPLLLAPDQITNVFIGPHICARHFVFPFEGPEIAAFIQKFPGAVSRDQALHLSLRHVVHEYLQQWHVKNSLIREDARCTFEDATLPSYCRWLQGNKKGTRGRMVTIVSP